MKTVYFSPDLPSYKANLHCHTTCSDGNLTPEQIKELYVSKGYSIVAYSDHNILVDHSDLNDEGFLAMLAIECDVTKEGNERKAFRPCYHINLFPRSSHSFEVPNFKAKADPSAEQLHIGECFHWDYDDVQDMIDWFNSMGFLAMLNHPTWSLQTAADYRKLHGCFAMELYNHSSVLDGFDEYNTAIWDDLLTHGMKIYGTATDDNHNRHSVDSPRFDSCGGFTVIQAKVLTQEAVTDALETGRFYASTGPLFYSIILEDDILKVECSPVRKIVLTTGHRQGRIAFPEAGESTLTSATFDLHRILSDSYVRLTLVDPEGNFAWSQPIRNYIGKKE